MEWRSRDSERDGLREYDVSRVRRVDMTSERPRGGGRGGVVSGWPAGVGPRGSGLKRTRGGESRPEFLRMEVGLVVVGRGSVAVAIVVDLRNCWYIDGV